MIQTGNEPIGSLGYDGPLDQDNNVPDPDDPANRESLSALAALSEI